MKHNQWMCEYMRCHRQHLYDLHVPVNERKTHQQRTKEDENTTATVSSAQVIQVNLQLPLGDE